MRMAGAWFVALVLPLVLVGSAPVVRCGSVEINAAVSSQGYCFFVGGAAVDRAAFCEALVRDISGGGVDGAGEYLAEKVKILENHCAGDSSLEGRTNPSAGRKLLLTASASAPGFLAFPRRFQPTEEEDSSTPSQRLELAASGMLLLCCAFICPCFRSRPKDNAEQPVLGRTPKSTDLSSSFDGNSKSHKSNRTQHHCVLRSPPRFFPSREERAVSSRVDLSQILKATHHFSESHKIGEGGFGAVYKAVLPDGRIVAVKRARKEHLDAVKAEFSNEIDLLAKIEHRCLVRFVDYVDQRNERLIITEYVSNGTLRDHLDGQLGKILSFAERMEIAIDVAHGLTYLHLYAEKRIIHRDVKSSNILLTEDWRAKVADFGFAKTSSTEDEQTQMLTKVKGTAGYLDPEYLRTFQLSPKSDVFSFGILLLEIISGRRPLDPRRPPTERTTVKWAFEKFTKGHAQEILDPQMREEVDGEVLRRILSLAFRCAANVRANRPDMREVVEELWSIRRAFTRTLSPP